MSHLHTSQLPLYNHIRNSILTHALLFNPFPDGRLEILTCPNEHGSWDARIIVLTQEPYECRILTHVSDSAGEVAAMQYLLGALQFRSRRMLDAQKVGESFRIREEREDWVERRSLGGSPTPNEYRGRGNVRVPSMGMSPVARREWEDGGRWHDGIPLTDQPIPHSGNDQPIPHSGNDQPYRRGYSLFDGPSWTPWRGSCS
jgi:hypothetical protein